ncbi:dynamin family protein [Cupriavidus basilensis]|uniref:dynamin family protein n=1 Tax=Cupriavidus basilensis TaxID=68895 RepID=UPI0023E8E4E9|nr:dynamin family protein [Cupriavidus basilensis]MDF3883261.1 dynamin family protein [Cupriavidus basilensis]
MDQEGLFIDELDNFKVLEKNMEGAQKKLKAWQLALTKALSVEPNLDDLKADSALASQARQIRERVQDCIAGWQEKWDASAPMRKLSENFGDKAVLLVFGKVNAGKSSFCNFLAERFAAQGKDVQYFYLDNDSSVNTKDRFVEGATETTSRIQGIYLGSRLILLDTPGLHSVTEENGELTKRFTDSADAVLWLSSSNSPGQVQELRELRDELRSNKPLLPVITKSDFFEEDEVDGQLVKVLQNKTRKNRDLQESDVLSRAKQSLEQSELAPDLVRRPVSVSVYAARKGTHPGESLEAAGFQNLFGELQVIAQNACGYKSTKAAQLTINHLEAEVLASLRRDILPQLDKLWATASGAISTLDTRAEPISSAIVGEVLGGLADLLDKYKHERDEEGLYRELSALCRDTIGKHVRLELAEYVSEMNTALFDMASDGRNGFEDLTVEVEVVSGRAKQAASSAAASATGMAIGTLLGGPVGGAIGGFLGGWLGNKAGDYFVETRHERRPVGVSYDKLYSRLETDLRKRLPEALADTLNVCKSSIQNVVDEATRLKHIVTESETKLETLKKEIRDESV